MSAAEGWVCLSRSTTNGWRQREENWCWQLPSFVIFYWFLLWLPLVNVLLFDRRKMKIFCLRVSVRINETLRSCNVRVSARCKLWAKAILHLFCSGVLWRRWWIGVASQEILRWGNFALNSISLCFLRKGTNHKSFQLESSEVKQTFLD